MSYKNTNFAAQETNDDGNKSITRDYTIERE